MSAAKVAIGLALLGALGCGKTLECKRSTLLVYVTIDPNVRADSLVVSFSGVAASPLAAPRYRPGDTSGSVEIDFAPEDYPAGKTVAVTVAAVSQGAIVGSGASAGVTLNDRCGALFVDVVATSAGAPLSCSMLVACINAGNSDCAGRATQQARDLQSALQMCADSVCTILPDGTFGPCYAGPSAACQECGARATTGSGPCVMQQNACDADGQAKGDGP
jgi:hypothetical protein